MSIFSSIRSSPPLISNDRARSFVPRSTDTYINVPEIVRLSAVGSVAIGRPSSPSAIVSRMRADSRTVIANRRVALMRHNARHASSSPRLRH